MPGPTRGRFRRGRRLLSHLLALLPILGAACGRIPPEPPLHARDGFAMGTVVEMKVPARDADAASRALDAAFAELARVEAVATPHDPASELSRIHARAGSTFVAGPEIDALLEESLRVAEESGGAFDPTVGALVALWGFPERPALPDSAAVREAREHVGWTRLHRGPSPRSWVLADPAARLDFGGIACGWAVDRAADLLASASGSCLLNAGGDVAVRGTRPDGRPWVLGVQHPRDRSALVCRLRVPEGFSVATSGDYEHFLDVGGVRWHHILDPATGWPARGLAGVTVIAPTCVLADAWSTAAFVLGPEEGMRRIEEHPDLEGIFLSIGPRGDLVVRETSGVAALRLP